MFIIIILKYNYSLGCIQTISIIGPVFGYLLGSICAGIYVDIGFVDMGKYRSDSKIILRCGGQPYFKVEA